jgi:tetratricopeptide (TPR) repeat protein
MWRWLQRLFAGLRWLLGGRGKPVVARRVQVVRGDEEYLLLLNDLLDRLAVEPRYATLTAWSIMRGVKEGELAVWLRGAVEQLDENLRGRLELLVKLRRGDLSLVAEEILGTAKTTVQGFSSDDAEEWFDRGNSLCEEGRYEDAIKSYDRAVSIKPDYYEAWGNRGITLDNLGRYEDAIKSYDRAISIKPDSYEAWYRRGLDLDDLGRYEDAIKSHDRAIFIEPDSYEAWGNRGLPLNNLGRYEDAIKSYDHAIFIKYDYHRAWYNRGIALVNLGKYEDAIKSYDRVISIKPDTHQAWYGRGSALGISGRFEDAIKSYDHAISIKYDYHRAWCNRGLSLDNLGRYEDAIKNYQQGLSHLQPTTHPEGWGELYYRLGQLHYGKGQNSFDRFRLDSGVYYRQAITAFQEAATTLPKFPELYLELIQDFMKVYSALREPEKANSYCEQGRELFKQLLNNQAPLKRRKLLAKFNSFRQLEVDILLQ